MKDAVKSFLEAPALGTGRGGGRRTAAPRRPATGRRTGREDAAFVPGDTAGSDTLDRVREAIAQAAEGAGKSELLAATGISDGQWNAAINSLLSQGLVTRTGEGRGARYHIAETGGRS